MTGRIAVRRLVSLMSLAAVIGLCADVTAGAAGQPPAPLVNGDVLEMVKGGLPESTIVGAIQTNPSNFDVSPAALIALNKAGVSETVMNAMLDRKSVV